VSAYHLRQAISTLSGVNWLLLAYRLVMPRKLLVLDEAFAGVDVQARRILPLNELKREEVGPCCRFPMILIW